jgi:hypothetical protein
MNLLPIMIRELKEVYMKAKTSRRKIIIIITVFIILIVFTFLIYPIKYSFDITNTQSITIEIGEYNEIKSTSYIKEITDQETIQQIGDILSNITYRRISYASDIFILGYPGYKLEITDFDGNINVITVYFDDTVRIQSNGRYKLNDGISAKMYEELLDLIKSKYYG